MAYWWQLKKRVDSISFPGLLAATRGRQIEMRGKYDNGYN